MAGGCPTAAPGTWPSVRSQPSSAGRRSHPPLSAPRADPRTPLATSVRALAACSARAWSSDRPVQRQRRADRGGARHRRDRRDPGRAQPLARGQRASSGVAGILRRARPPAAGVSVRSAAASGSQARSRSTPCWPRSRRATARRRTRSRSPGSSDLSPAIVPLPGATRVETARSLGRAPPIVLTRRGARAPRRALSLRPAARFRAVGRCRTARTADRRRGRARHGPAGRRQEHGGRSARHARLRAAESRRSRRNARGARARTRSPRRIGRLAHRARQHLRLAQGRAPRSSQAASKHGLPVRCVWLSTTSRTRR